MRLSRAPRPGSAWPRARWVRAAARALVVERDLQDDDGRVRNRPDRVRVPQEETLTAERSTSSTSVAAELRIEPGAIRPGAARVRVFDERVTLSVRAVRAVELERPDGEADHRVHFRERGQGEHPGNMRADTGEPRGALGRGGVEAQRVPAITEHTTEQRVVLGNIMRDLVELSKVAKNSCYLECEETGKSSIDTKALGMYLKTVDQITNIYKMENYKNQTRKEA
eukprot:CAMPEP_0179458320 /NCGR_PEP_ID=MMETSP0799-20121207/41899_1 /TAXON_ID=46947 /ORGANISM="Geminigera cryophila, Strain CCMP2564" /LENGTH=224 /DNA_ID=CAMNT_0021259511 /DNA_START=53 /DNA_END=730 /DNA_ORIENTATION=-